MPEGCPMNVIMTALAPLESRHPRLGQSLWWLWFMRPQCRCVCGGGVACTTTATTATQPAATQRDQHRRSATRSQTAPPAPQPPNRRPNCPTHAQTAQPTPKPPNQHPNCPTHAQTAQPTPKPAVVTSRPHSPVQIQDYAWPRLHSRRRSSGPSNLRIRTWDHVCRSPVLYPLDKPKSVGWPATARHSGGRRPHKHNNAGV